MTKEAKHKQKFRTSAKWKKFRAYMKKKYKVDAITGKPLRAGWQLHHLDMSDENYEDLKEENFICLNRNTHKIIHEIFRYDTDQYLYNMNKYLCKMKELNKAISNKAISNKAQQ